MENKLWCLGITQNRKEKISNLITAVKPYVDGFVWVDHYSNDGTYELLEENKGEGKIYQLNFTKNHGLSMTYALTAGHIKMGQWVLICDSSDLPNHLWLKNLREDISYYEKNGVNTILLDRPLLFRYFDHQTLPNPVHWTLYPVIGKVVNLSQIPGYRKENYIFNTRDFLQSAFKNPCKYLFEYGNSNNSALLYSQFGQQIHDYHENIRLQFRLFCYTELKIELTLDSLIKYMVENIGNYPDFFEQVMELETNLKDMFRLYVLKQDLSELLRKRFDWSYFLWKKTGDATQKDSSWVSNWNQYKKAAGLPTEV